MRKPTAVLTNRPDLESPGSRVQVFSGSVLIRDVSVGRQAVVAYLQGISPDQQELALVNALEAGVAAIRARRR